MASGIGKESLTVHENQAPSRLPKEFQHNYSKTKGGGEKKGTTECSYSDHQGLGGKRWRGGGDEACLSEGGKGKEFHHRNTKQTSPLSGLSTGGKGKKGRNRLRH